MAKINKEEYEVLKGLGRIWKWIARDGSLCVYFGKPNKHTDYWEDEELIFKKIDENLFQFIRWEDEEPYNIQELIDEYESEGTEVKKDLEWAKDEVRKIAGKFPTYHDERDDKIKMMASMHDVLAVLDQLDEPEPKNIALQDVTQRLWELPLNSRKHWLERLNDEFKEGYIVPLGLKTTDWEEQYLTFNGSYFACRRDKSLKQTFATLEEIPEFYRDLAERML